MKNPIGLNQDLSAIDNDGKQLTFMLNGQIGSHQGDTGSVTNAPGNTECWQLFTGYVPIGTIDMGTYGVAVFSTNGTRSEIGIVEGCNYTQVVNTTCLGFSSPIKGQFSVKRGCERVIYWVDGVNNDRTFNFDRPDEYKTSGDWDCDLFDINKGFVIPVIDSMVVEDSGGLIEIGAYIISFRYLDSSLNPTQFFTHTRTIRITDDSNSEGYWQVDGAYNLEANYTAEVGGLPKTNKSITLNLSNLDESFEFLEVAVTKYTSGDGFTRSSYIIDRVPVNSTSRIQFTGIDNAIEQIDTEELKIPQTAYTTSKEILQVENRLVRADVCEQFYDWAKFQQRANGIVGSYITQTADEKLVSDPIVSKSPQYTFRNQSLMRDEVYPFAVQWYLEGNVFSPPFTIPGPDETDDLSGNSDTHYRNTVPVSNSWDKQALTVVASGATGGTQVNLSDVRHIPLSEFSCSAGGGCESIRNLTFTVTRESLTQTKIEWDLPGTVTGTIDIFEYDGLNETSIYSNSVPASGTTITHAIPTETQFGINIYIDVTQYTHTDACDYSPVADEPFRFIFFKEINFPKTQTIEYHSDTNPPVSETSSDRVGCTIERWKVYNTAVASTGRCGYYESSVAYPDTTDCDGVRVYPQGNIRHFRMPDTTLEPHMDTSDRPISLGMHFTNIYPPEEYTDKVIGYRILVGKRTSANKTVLDKGIVERTLAFTGTNYNLYMQSTPFNYDDKLATANFAMSSQFIAYHAPRSKFNNSSYAGDHIKLERVLSGEQFFIRDSVNTSGPNYGPADNESLAIFGDRRSYVYLKEDASETATMSEANFKIDEMVFMPYNTRHYFDGNDRILNDYSQSSVFAKLSDSIDHSGFTMGEDHGDDTYYYYASVKRWSRVAYSRLDQIQYIIMHNNLHTGESLDVYGGDVYISDFNFRKTADDTEDFLDEVGALDLRVTRGPRTSWINFMVESELDASMRHEGLGTQVSRDGESTIRSQRYFPKSYTSIDEYLRLEPEYTNYFEYNKDFSASSDVVKYQTLPTTYDYCTDCPNCYPHRIIWSPRSFDQERADAYRTVLTNDARDLPAYTGRITNLFYKNSKELFAQTEQMIYRLYPYPQQLNTLDNEVYLGSGEFLSVEPTPLSRSLEGYGGNTGRFNTISTKYGVFFIDLRNRKVYRFANNLEPISDRGMSSFFEENLRFFMDEALGKSYYLKDDISNELAIGTYATYDPRFDQYIIHKRDFYPRFSFTEYNTTASYNNGDYIYVDTVFPSNINEKGFYLRDEGNWDRVDLFDETLFENKSFTLSYNIHSEVWNSFHSYFPSFWYYDVNNFYSFDYDNQSWKHLYEGNYQTYYGKKYSFITELVGVTSPQTLILDSVEYMLHAANKVDDNWVNQEMSFDHLIVRNRHQSTNKLSLSVNPNPYQAARWSETETPLYLKDNNHRINRLYDSHSSGNIISHNWSDIILDDEMQIDTRHGYLDWVLDNQDTTNDYYDIAHIRDKYVNLRLISNKQTDTKLTLDIQSVNVRPSIR